MNKKRTSLELIASILSTCKQPTTKTRIMQKVYLSWQQTCYYTEELLKRHFIEKEGKIYLLTLLGREFEEGVETLFAIWNNEPAVMITA